jgi:general stress protein 26
MAIKVARFKDVASGTQNGQFTVGDRDAVTSLDDLDPIYKTLIDEPVTAVVAVMGSTGRPNLTPVWFDYSGDTVFLNLSTERTKVEWLRKNPQVSFILVNQKNPYHCMRIKATAVREISEDDPVEGPRVTQQLDFIWTKYTGQEGPYGLRDPGFDERRILFELKVDSLATFGKP